jgi:hypothetical protein
MVHSRARGTREELAFLLGSDILRCSSCGARFLRFVGFSIPTPTHNTTAGAGDSFMIVWLAIIAGLLSCIGFGLWTLRRFHRWPF